MISVILRAVVIRRAEVILREAGDLLSRPIARAAFTALLLAAPLRAQTAPPDKTPTYDTLTVVSRILSETRRVNVHVPPGYTVSSGTHYPVIYMPDGGLDEDFAHVVNTVDSLVIRRLIPPSIVVGIPNTERRRDLTGPTSVHSDSAVAPHVGGSDAFRRFIRHELFPVIDRRYRTSDARTVVGESLAGLFIVETFLREPAMFDHAIAFDPSLWWNHGALVDSTTALVQKWSSRLMHPKTLYFAASADDIGNQSARLDSALSAAHPLMTIWHYEARSDLGHGTIFRALLPAALVRTLGRP